MSLIATIAAIGRRPNNTAHTLYHPGAQNDPTALLEPGWHREPDGPLTVAGAHKGMQEHLTCTLKCPYKFACYRTLVYAGVLKPDSGRAG